MSKELSDFLNGLEIAAALACIDYVIKNLHNANLDFGAFDGLTKRVILTVLGKIQTALLDATKGERLATLFKSEEPQEELKMGWN